MIPGLSGIPRFPGDWAIATGEAPKELIDPIAEHAGISLEILRCSKIP